MDKITIESEDGLVSLTVNPFDDSGFPSREDYFEVFMRALRGLGFRISTELEEAIMEVLDQ